MLDSFGINRAIELSDQGQATEARVTILEGVEPLVDTCVRLFNDTIEHNINLAGQEVDAARSRVQNGVLITGAVLGLAALVGILLAIGITRSLSQTLSSVSDALESSAVHTAEASEQLASINRTVAAGCAEQGS